MNRLLTIQPEVVERLRMSRAMVHRLIASGELRSIKIGRSRRVPESAIDEFIERKLSEQGD